MKRRVPGQEKVNPIDFTGDFGHFPMALPLNMQVSAGADSWVNHLYRK